MVLGEAIAIFNNIEDSERTVEEKREAIRMVLDMETKNSITKQSILKAMDWLWYYAHFAISDVKQNEIVISTKTFDEMPLDVKAEMIRNMEGITLRIKGDKAAE